MKTHKQELDRDTAETWKTESI